MNNNQGRKKMIQLDFISAEGLGEVWEGLGGNH